MPGNPLLQLGGLQTRLELLQIRTILQRGLYGLFVCFLRFVPGGRIAGNDMQRIFKPDQVTEIYLLVGNISRGFDKILSALGNGKLRVGNSEALGNALFILSEPVQQRLGGNQRRLPGLPNLPQDIQAIVGGDNIGYGVCGRGAKAIQ
jgi:hypothetical protein